MHNIPSPPQAFFDEAGVNADDRVWDYGRACYALALSRGVPPDMVLVPREPTEAMLEAAFQNVGPYPSLIDYWRAMIKAAPAAAGAQGGAVCSNCNGRGEVGGPVGQTAETFDYVTEPCPDCNAPQPAAADGGVREMAREILIQALQDGGAEETARIMRICDDRDDWWAAFAIRAIADALSSHRQAGDESLYALHSRFLSDTSGLPEEWQDWRNDFARDIRNTATPPGPDLSKFRELAEEWKARAKEARQEAEEETSEVMYHANLHQAAAYSGCAYAVLALVEKGAGS